MPKLIPTTALGVALALGGPVYAQLHAQPAHMDTRMHHQMSSNASVTDDSFDAQMERAMTRMDKDMMVPPSGDYDRDFAAMMIPHHQGAVDMARIELQFGKDPVLRRLAQAIIVEQLQEIDVMQRELQQLPAASSQSAPASAESH